MTLIEQLRAALHAALERMHTASAAVEAAHERVLAAGDDDDLEALRTAVDGASSAFEDARAEVERCRANVDAEEQRAAFVAANPQPAAARVTVVGDHEPRTYRERGPHSFFGDAYAFKTTAAPEARERLERHGREVLDDLRERGLEYRDVGTGAFAGLTIPQFLIDLNAPLARAGSPVVNAMRKLPLPDRGMVLSISRGTTGTAVAAQASENAAVQETNYDDTKLDVDVRTYAGMQDVSRQALERSELVDELVFADLIADYFTKLDDAALNADGTSGTHLGARSTGSIIAVSYTDASPTVAEFYSKLADAVQRINKQRNAPASAIVMAPVRWGYLTAAADSTGRPLVVPNPSGPWNALAVGQAAEYGQVVGSLLGLPVITDGNVPENLGAGTNEDIVLIMRTADHPLFWEGDGNPRSLRFEDVGSGSLTVKLVVYGYSAMTFGRYPKAVATVGGTGLVAPTF